MLAIRYPDECDILLLRRLFKRRSNKNFLFVYSDANSEVRAWAAPPMTLSVSDPLTHNPTHNRKLLSGNNGAARKQMLLILGYKPSNGAENGR